MVSRNSDRYPPRWSDPGRLLPALTLLAALVFPSGCGSNHPPNVILITVSSLRQDRLSCLGARRPTTPEIDALARSSTLFGRCYAQSTDTAPAHASILTGVWPWKHGDPGGDFRPSREIPTLAQIYRDAGYMTAAIVSSSELDRDRGFDRGFEHFDDSLPFRVDRIGLRTKEATGTTDAAVAWLSAHSAFEPFFLWIHYADPLGPYRPPEAYLNLFRNDEHMEYSENLEISDQISGPGIIPAHQARLAETNPSEYVAAYDAEVRFLDNELGRLCSEIERLRLYKRSILVLTSAHGESLGEDKYFFQHGHSTSEEQVRVPLLLRGSGVRQKDAPDRATALAHVDIVPTLLALTGVPAPPGLDGTSLLPLLSGTGWPTERSLYCISGSGKVRSVIRDTLKLTVDDRSDKKMLYDVGVDRYELDDLYSRDDARAIRLEQDLDTARRP